MRRTLALWLLLFGVYAATIGLDAVRRLRLRRRRAPSPAGRRVAGRGPRRRRARRVRRAAYADYYPEELERRGQLTEGRLNEPYGFGFALLLVPAWLAGRDPRRGAVPGGDRRAGRGARLPAGPPRGARPVGHRRRGRGGAEPALPGLRQRRVSRAGGGRGAGRRRAAGHPPRRASRTGARRSAASRCSARCPGWARSSCPPAW